MSRDGVTPLFRQTGHKIKLAIVLAQHTPYIHWPYQPCWCGRNVPIVGATQWALYCARTRRAGRFSLSVFTVLHNFVYISSAC